MFPRRRGWAMAAGNEPASATGIGRLVPALRLPRRRGSAPADPERPRRHPIRSGRAEVHGICAFAAHPLYDTTAACRPGFAENPAKRPPRRCDGTPEAFQRGAAAEGAGPLGTTLP
jgi:hypothetical protein